MQILNDNNDVKKMMEQSLGQFFPNYPVHHRISDRGAYIATITTMTPRGESFEGSIILRKEEYENNQIDKLVLLATRAAELYRHATLTLDALGHSLSDCLAIPYETHITLRKELDRNGKA